MNTNRRHFIAQAVPAGGALAVPYFWTSQSTRAQDINSKPTIAAIGVGGSRSRYARGRTIARHAAKLGKMIAVCDVDELHSAEFNAEFDGKLQEFVDYRVLFDSIQPDVVTIGTPDHSHVPIAIAAMRAGCDVYCEKPVTLTVEEGKQICEVVKETKRVFQVGSQQRSEFQHFFLTAAAIVRLGMLGKNVNAYVALGSPPVDGPFKETAPPEGLHWDLWLGSAPKAAYSQARRKMFRWYFDYAGGKMTDWGAHHVDIAQWALGKADTGPVSVKGSGEFPPIVPENFKWNAYLDGEASLPNAYMTPTKFQLDLTFEDESLISVNNYYKRDDGTEFGNGILFEGENGRIFVNRGKLAGKIVEALSESEQQKINAKMIELYNGKEPNGHMHNFFECLEDRQDPISDIYSHHRTITSCHMCNIALMLGRELRWDPEAQVFSGDDQANLLMSRKSRYLPII